MIVTLELGDLLTLEIEGTWEPGCPPATDKYGAVEDPGAPGVFDWFSIRIEGGDKFWCGKSKFAMALLNRLDDAIQEQAAEQARVR